MLAWHGASGDLEQKALQAGARPEAEWLQINAVLGARNKKLLGAPGIATRSKDATRGS